MKTRLFCTKRLQCPRGPAGRARPQRSRRGPAAVRPGPAGGGPASSPRPRFSALTHGQAAHLVLREPVQARWRPLSKMASVAPPDHGAPRFADEAGLCSLRGRGARRLLQPGLGTEQPDTGGARWSYCTQRPGAGATGTAQSYGALGLRRLGSGR